ncbi:MAG: tetratricopeptide repeat protein [Candidatus Omnitrophica bacterium]|nr:tetratricopeptide repeat protein [Candidatus Omnitrophota bacterium]
MKSKIFFCFALTAVLFSAILPGFSEDVTNEVRTVRRETRSVKQAVGVAEKSKEKEAADKFRTGVTYEDILKDPDNIALNARYAQDQIARGNLLGAAAALERILLLNPDLPDVRLLYAVVLYRLDSLNEAQKEIDTLRNVTLPPEIRAQLKDYEKKIKYRKRRTHFGLRQSNGWGYDTNRNASPHSKTQLFYDTALPVEGSNVRRPDTHFLNVTSVDVTHDLGFQAGHTVFGNFTYFLQEQTNVHSLNLGSFQYELGGTYKAKYFNFTPSYYYNYLFLSDQSFLRSQGGSFLFDRDLSKKLNVSYNFRMERQDFMNISENTDSYNRKGPEFDHVWGANYVLCPTMRWNSNIGYGEKFAKQNYYAYDRISLNNSHTWIWPKGQFVINTLSAYFDRYQSPQFSVSSMHRHDNTIRYRATYGVPLGTAFFDKILPGPLKDIVLTISYEYYHALSSITNYTYTNNKIEGLLTKRMEF